MTEKERKAYWSGEWSFWLFANAIVLVIVSFVIPSTEQPSNINAIKSFFALLSINMTLIGVWILYRNHRIEALSLVKSKEG